MHGHAYKQYIFRACNIYFQCYAFLMKIISRDSAKKEDKKASGFQIPHFYGSFSNDIMAMKGLTSTEATHGLLGIVT